VVFFSRSNVAARANSNC